MLESLIQRASEMILGTAASHTLLPTTTGRPCARRGGSEASGQFTGVWHLTLVEPSVVVATSLVLGTLLKVQQQKESLLLQVLLMILVVAKRTNSPTMPPMKLTLASLKAEAPKDQDSLSRNQRGRFTATKVKYLSGARRRVTRSS